jgi:hypothetical protein
METLNEPFLATIDKRVRRLSVLLAVCFLVAANTAAQSETLTNHEVILLTRAGLSQELIIRKIRDSGKNFDITAEGLIELKKAGVADEVIALMMEKSAAAADSPNNDTTPGYSDSVPVSGYSTPSHIVLDPKEALRSAKTIAIEKSSLHPSRQALEKELLKRKEWKDFNLNIVRYKEGADLYIEIGFVPFSLITHRYVWRVFDNKSGTVIAAGETTSWGSLAKNLARDISKKLSKVL